MTDVTADGVLHEMRSALVQVAGSREPGETIERWLERAARRLGIPYARAFNYWHRRVRRVDAVEYLAVQRRAKAHASARIEELRAELAILEGITVVQATSAPVDTGSALVLERRVGGDRRSGQERRRSA